MCLICITLTFGKYFLFETSFIITPTMLVRSAVLLILLSILYLEMNRSVFIDCLHFFSMALFLSEATIEFIKVLFLTHLLNHYVSTKPIK